MAATTALIEAAAPDWLRSRWLLTMTPITTSATSGATLTSPVPETVTVCSGAAEGPRQAGMAADDGPTDHAHEEAGGRNHGDRSAEGERAGAAFDRPIGPRSPVRRVDCRGRIASCLRSRPWRSSVVSPAFPVSFLPHTALDARTSCWVPAGSRRDRATICGVSASELNPWRRVRARGLREPWIEILHERWYGRTESRALRLVHSATLPSASCRRRDDRVCRRAVPIHHGSLLVEIPGRRDFRRIPGERPPRAGRGTGSARQVARTVPGRAVQLRSRTKSRSCSSLPTSTGPGLAGERSSSSSLGPIRRGNGDDTRGEITDAMTIWRCRTRLSARPQGLNERPPGGSAEPRVGGAIPAEPMYDPVACTGIGICVSPAGRLRRQRRDRTEEPMVDPTARVRTWRSAADSPAHLLPATRIGLSGEAASAPGDEPRAHDETRSWNLNATRPRPRPDGAPRKADASNLEGRARRGAGTMAARTFETGSHREEIGPS